MMQQWELYRAFKTKWETNVKNVSGFTVCIEADFTKNKNRIYEKNKKIYI